MKVWLIVALILLGIFLLIFVAGAALFWSLGKPPSVSSDTVVEVVLGGSLSEAPSDNPIEVLFGTEGVTLYDYWRLFDYASRDDRVRSIYLEIRPLAFSWAQLEELRDSINHFRRSEKPVHAFLAVDVAGESELYLASAADTITLNPDAALLVNGLVAEVTFYRQALQKLGVEPHFIQFKEYKSPEVYTRRRLSPPVRDMYRDIISDLENRFVQTMVKDRGTTEAGLRALISQGVATSELAKEVGLIDHLGYRADVMQRLQGEEEEKPQRMKAAAYLESAEAQFRVYSRHRVALVTGTGVITSGKSNSFAANLGGSTLAAHLRQIRRRKNLDAVLMRVDSPGGSAVGSDMVWNEVRRLQEAGKPVVISMSGVAGSGGYYIAMGANKIICQPSTITGSIGVIFGKFNLEGLFNLLGMEIDRVKLSPNADLFSPFTPLDDKQRDQVTNWMEAIYDNFVQKAAQGRGLNVEELEAKARGRIYTGSQALEIGLVDELGGYRVALQHLRKEMGLSEDATIELVPYPKRKTVWEALADPDLFKLRQPNFFLGWLQSNWSELTRVVPRTLMPEARIY